MLTADIHLSCSLYLITDYDVYDLTVRYHGYSEPFWIWIEDGGSEYIYHSENFLLQKKMFFEHITLEFTIPIREPIPNQYFLRVVSDRW